MVGLVEEADGHAMVGFADGAVDGEEVDMTDGTAEGQVVDALAVGRAVELRPPSEFNSPQMVYLQSASTAYDNLGVDLSRLEEPR